MDGVNSEFGELELYERIESEELPAKEENGNYYIERRHLNEIIDEVKEDVMY